ncbi:hypothetical protein F4801DRAFT_574843 [Xylaria longipes]|nr:hypothetical protein F4801DRAFT_574843 [Xylaria longipes]
MAPSPLLTPYRHEIDLDGNMLSTHCAFPNHIQQELSVYPSPWANNGFQQNTHLQPIQMSGQDAQQNSISHPGLIGNYKHDWGYPGNDNFVGSPNFQPDPSRDRLTMNSWGMTLCSE